MPAHVVVVQDVADVVVRIIPMHAPPDVLVADELLSVEDAGIILPPKHSLRL